MVLPRVIGKPDPLAAYPEGSPCLARRGKAENPEVRVFLQSLVIAAFPPTASESRTKPLG